MDERLMERIRQEFTTVTSPSAMEARAHAEATLPTEARAELAERRADDLVRYFHEAGFPSAVKCYHGPASYQVELGHVDAVKLAANIQRLRELRADG